MRKTSLLFKHKYIGGAVIAITLLVVLYIKSESLYFNYAIAQGAAHSSFIQDRQVLLDKRVQNKHGSWGADFNLNDPITVELVYNELQNILQYKDQVLLIDVGANTGSYALLPVLSKKINVIAFEPNPEMVELLNNNIKLNRITKNVTIVQIGISDSTNMLELNIPNDAETGLSTFGKNILRFDANNCKTISVPVESLDKAISHLCSTAQKIDFIKIDTEGWEYFVLKGAKNILLTDRPLLLLEYYLPNMEQAGVDPNSVDKLLAELNYSCELITGDLFCRPVN